MLTGDNLNNAINFAKSCSILGEDEHEDAVLEGAQFEKMVGEV
jgi:magnesium-transporting ATPase (P-type)